MSTSFDKKISGHGLGFTLVEVLVALFMTSVGIGAAYTLINQTLASIRIASNSLSAAYLGKEGVEIVKNIRDSNYLKIHHGFGNWNDGLCVGDLGGCGADYEMDALSPAYTGVPLKFDGNFFNYSDGINTKFTRKITVTSPQPDVLNIIVKVDWSERGRAHSMTVQENLYNWWQ